MFGGNLRSRRCNSESGGIEPVHSSGAPIDSRRNSGSEEKSSCSDGTKARYAFVYGDFRRVHRSGLIACVYRAAEWRHKSVERAAYDLLQRLDKATGVN